MLKFMTLSQKKGHLRSIFPTSGYCHPKVETIFMNISAKTQIFLKIFYGATLGPRYYRFMTKTRISKSLATVPLSEGVWELSLSTYIYAHCQFFVELTRTKKASNLFCFCKNPTMFFPPYRFQVSFSRSLYVHNHQVWISLEYWPSIHLAFCMAWDRIPHCNYHICILKVTLGNTWENGAILG